MSISLRFSIKEKSEKLMLFSLTKGRVLINWVLLGREFIETVFKLLSTLVISPKTKGNDSGSMFFSTFGLKHQILFPIFIIFFLTFFNIRIIHFFWI